MEMLQCVSLRTQSSLPCPGESVSVVPRGEVVIFWIIQMAVHKGFCQPPTMFPNHAHILIHKTCDDIALHGKGTL